MLSALTIKGEFNKGYQSGTQHDFDDVLCAANMTKVRQGVRLNSYPMVQAYWLGYLAALTDTRVTVKDRQCTDMLNWLRAEGYDIRVDQNAVFEVYTTRNVPEHSLFGSDLFDLIHIAYCELHG